MFNNKQNITPSKVTLKKFISTGQNQTGISVLEMDKPVVLFFITKDFLLLIKISVRASSAQFLAYTGLSMPT